MGFFFRILLLLAIIFLPICSSSLLVASVTLSGRILDDVGQPLDLVHLSVEASDKVIFERDLSLSSQGQLHVDLGAVQSDQVRCSIVANGFEKAQVTAIVHEGTALLGTIKLKRYLEIRLAQILEHAEEHYVDLDFWVLSHAERSIIIEQVILGAPGPKGNACASPPPLLNMHFDSMAVLEAHPKKSGDYELAAILRVRQEANTPSATSYHVTGSYRYDACGPSIIKVTIPYSFTLDMADQNQPRRVRIELPSTIQVGNSDKVRPNWQNSSLRVVLAGGETINAIAIGQK